MRAISVLAVFICIAVLAGAFPPDMTIYGVPFPVIAALVAGSGFAYVLSRG